MNLPEIHLDGNWVDFGSIITGLLYIAVQKYRRAKPCNVISKVTGLDFANGAALFPLLILTFSVLSSDLVRSLVEASKMSLSVAGFFALLAILEEPDSSGPP